MASKNHSKKISDREFIRVKFDSINNENSPVVAVAVDLGVNKKKISKKPQPPPPPPPPSSKNKIKSSLPSSTNSSLYSSNESIQSKS